MSAHTSQELIAEWLAGELNPEGIARLLALCQEEPEILENLVRSQCLDRLLRVAVLDAGPEAFVQEVALRCGAKGEADSDLLRRVRMRLGWARRLQFAAAACLILGVAFLGWWQIRPIATVARLEAARWPEGSEVRHAGDKLRRGHLSLLSGYASLRFAHGAELLVEGPADLELVSRDLVRMRSGSAFAHVPPEAIGFTLEGPTGRVVDKGTDFGVHVGQGGMEVHVLKGEVEAGRGSALQTLRESQAVQISDRGVSTIPVNQGSFLTGLPPAPRGAIGWVHWPLDEGAGATSQAMSAGLQGTNSPARLLSLAGASPGPQWTTGQFGAALAFDGEDDYVQTDFPGIAGAAQRTVAFWAKVPRNIQPQNGYAMVSWGSTQALTEGWQISINPKEDEGPLGRVRVARIGGPIIGTTDLRDDRWHHLAVVFYGGAQLAPSTQVLIYVDGDLENTARKGVLNVQTDTASRAARKVTFGLSLGPGGPDPRPPQTFHVFRGCLDEIFICNAALNQTQVRDLMVRNFTQAFAPAP